MERSQKYQPEQRAGMRLKEAAQYMGVSETTFRKYKREQLVTGYPVRPQSTHRRYTREELDKLRSMLSGQPTELVRTGDGTPTLSPLRGDLILKSLGL